MAEWIYFIHRARENLAATMTDAERERVAMRLIGGACIALALYAAAQATFVLVGADRPGISHWGIAWTDITCVAMLALAFGKARTGAALNNPVLTTEGRVTLVDAYLAGAVLLGLILNAALGLWWADQSPGS